jgi:urease accessory protein
MPSTTADSALGGFYGGLLHPLVVPAELMAVLAVGLLIGAGGRATCRAGLIVFAAGVTAGLLIARSISASIDLTTSLPLGVGLVAGILVAAGIQVPTALASLVALAAGMAIGIDAAPEAEALSPLLVAGVATVLGSTLAVMLVAVLVLDRNVHWQVVAVRVAGSWIAACSIIYFGWLIRASAAP